MTTKKKIIIALSGIISGGLVIFLFIFNHPGTQKFDLSKFSGRIFHESEIKPGTFTIDVPFKKTLTWGKDAILSYGKKGAKIWKPDNFTSGIFLFSCVGQGINDFGFYWYDSSIKNSKLIIQGRIEKNYLALFTMIFSIASMVIVAIIFYS